MLHKVVLAGRVRSNRLPVRRCRLVATGLVAAHGTRVLLASAASGHGLAVALVNRALTAANGALLGDEAAAHATAARAELPGPLLLAVRLRLSRVHLIERAHGPALLRLLLRV